MPDLNACPASPDARSTSDREELTAGPTIEPAPDRTHTPTTFAGFLAMAAADCVDGSTTVRPKCGRCGTNDEADEHGCPYAEEINDDFTTMCTCCDDCRDDCRHDCLMDI